MDKREFKKLLKFLSDEIKQSELMIIQSKTEKCFCARVVLCHFLSEVKGMTDKEIVKLTGITRQVVSNNRLNFYRLKSTRSDVRLLEYALTSYYQG